MNGDKNKDSLSEKTNTSHQTQFRLGLLSLCKGKTGFARVFFREAASQGNRRAGEYISMLDNNALSKFNWSRLVLDLEAKHILFGE